MDEKPVGKDPQRSPANAERDDNNSDDAISMDDTIARDDAISMDDTIDPESTIDPEYATSTDATMAQTGETALARLANELERDSSHPTVSGTTDLDELPTVDPTLYVRGAEIARGGMGRIIQARDRKLGRDLAIKELIEGTPALEKRFEREMKITARLQHPAIIAVHDAGRWPSGNAFYTMKHVDGKALDRVIADTGALRERLALLPTVLAVADALAYAHAEGVIHRDLKPGNILVGSFGETVVIDWGLAKELGDTSPDDSRGEASAARQDGSPADDGLTVLGEAMGTPAYMAPEQAEGKILDQRADVYAIGAILYHLLAGASPYADTKPRSAHELIFTVAKQSPTELAQLADDIPPDLLAIVTKAMARRASDRYPTAGELAEDLRRYQTGQLVGAHQYSSWALLKRWIGRHRAAVSVAAAMALLLAVGGAVSFWRIARERDRAEEQKTLAEANRSEVEDLLDFMLVELRDKLKPINKLDLLDMVADKAAGYFSARPIDWSRPAGARKRSLAHNNLGDVLLDQGNTAPALEQYRAARAITEQLLKLEPKSRRWQRDLAVNHNKVGNVLQAQGDASGAMSQYRAMVAIEERLAALDPADNQGQRSLAVSYTKVGNVLFAQHDVAAAATQYQAALAIRERLAEKNPANSQWQRDLSVTYNKLGDVLLTQGDVDGALERYQAMLRIDERLVKQNPENSQWQRDLAVSYNQIGDIFQAQGKLAGALEQYRATAAIAARLAQQDATNSARQWDLAVVDRLVGDILVAQGNINDALAEYRAALAIGERLVELDPTNNMWQQTLAGAHNGVGDVLNRQGDHEGALQHHRAGLAIAERLVKLDPTNYMWQRELGHSCELISGVLAARGDKQAARAYLRRGADIYAATAADANDFYNTACTYALAGAVDEGFAMLEKAVARGYRDSPWAEKDTDLAPLRKDPRWPALIESMKADK